MRLSSSPFRLILALVAALLLLHLGQSGAQVHAGGLKTLTRATPVAATRRARPTARSAARSAMP